MQQSDGAPTAAKSRSVPMAANPEEMELDEMDEAAEVQEGLQQAGEGEEALTIAVAGEEIQLQQKAVPAAVFGGVRDPEEDGSEATQPQPPSLGALDRFKKRKTQA